MKKADMRPPSSALWPTRCNSCRKRESAMISETLVLSTCATIHKNSMAGATNNQRLVKIQPPVADFVTSLAIGLLLSGQLLFPQRPGAFKAVLSGGLARFFRIQIRYLAAAQ